MLRFIGFVLMIFSFFIRTHLDFLFLTENELKFVQMRLFLKGIALLRIRK